MVSSSIHHINQINNALKDWIPGYLSQDAQVDLRLEMEEAASSSDEDGYIYTFEIIGT